MREPDGVLGEIARRKRSEVAARLAGTTLAELRGHARRTDRSLAGALGGLGARFIMEVKKASPSAGSIRPDCDPASQAAA